jgi:hypothetical protein
MRRILIPALLVVFSTAALAHEGHEHAAKPGKQVTVAGEVVDMTCYMQHPSSAVGIDHAMCAKCCVAKGLPIGFLATDGTLYTVIGSEHEPVVDRVSKFLGMPSTISGTLIEHHGVKAIEVGSISAQETKMNKDTGTTTQTVYTCPMHPEVRQNKPGNCPKCGMKLEPAKKK